MRRRLLLSALLALAPTALLAAGCGSAPAHNTVAGPPAGGAQGGGKVTITADPSGQIKWVEPKLSTTGGNVTVEMDNPSQVPHNVAVQSEDGQQIGPTSETLADGKTQIQVPLDPGTYRLVCLVPGHTATMNIPLEVKAGGGGGGGGAGDGGGETTVEADPGGQLKWVEPEVSAPAGSVTVHMKNPSQVPHNVAVLDAAQQQVGDVSETVTGADTQVTVDLKAGEYRLVCLVPGHTPTMNIPLKVTEGGGGGGGSGGGASTSDAGGGGETPSTGEMEKEGTTAGGGYDEGGGTDTGTDTAEGGETTTGAEGTTTGGEDTVVDDVVTVSPDGDRIAWSEDGAKATGTPLTIELDNPSQIGHNVAVLSAGRVVAKSETISESTTQIQASLQPGNYRLVCLVTGHTKTMNIPLEVT